MGARLRLSPSKKNVIIPGELKLLSTIQKMRGLIKESPASAFITDFDEATGDYCRPNTESWHRHPFSTVLRKDYSLN
jgi:hypothetical protein